MIEIPAITLWQPWASLLACLAKLYETRGWATSYRGPVAIHAAAKPVDIRNIPHEAHYPMAQALTQYARQFAHTQGFNIFNLLPRGAVIATAELVGCWRIAERVDGGVRAQENITGERKHIRTWGNEGLFGDFTPDRYAWEFANMKMLPEPIPAKGQQGLWKWRMPA